MTKKTATHGTVACHQAGRCRCDLCVAAFTAYERNRRRMRAYGRWQPFVDAEPVRQHLETLKKQGIGPGKVSTLSGVPTWTMDGLIRGRNGNAPLQKIRPETADAILAVTAEKARTEGYLVDATGSARRLRALMALGWPASALAGRLPLSPEHVRMVIRMTRPTTLRTTAAEIQALYDRLWNQSPESHGISKQTAATARNKAARWGWARPQFWNDDALDNPAAFPDFTGHCGTPSGWLLHQAWDEDPCDACAGHAIDLKDRPHVRVFVITYQGAIEALQADGWTWTRIGQFVHAKPDFVRDEYRKHTKDQMGVAA